MAALYIAVIVFLITYVAPAALGDEKTPLIPMTMLSVLVLSVALMGMLFFYEPARLFLENQKKEALSFFLKTIGTFASFILILVILLMYISLL
jgi:hypothetical protein